MMFFLAFWSISRALSAGVLGCYLILAYLALVMALLMIYARNCDGLDSCPYTFNILLMAEVTRDGGREKGTNLIRIII